MKKLRWQLLVVILALAAIAVLLFSQQPAIQQAGGGVPAIQPVSGGIYTEALVGSFSRLNPVLDYFNPADHDIDRLIYCSLLRFDTLGQPYGDLAEDWGISQDGTTYNFAIREDAVWHDGEPVTSSDVVLTVEMLRGDDSPLPEDLRDFWQQVEIKALDEKVLQFHLPEAFAPFLDYLAVGILPSHLLENATPETLADDSFNLNPVGCGPYRFDGMEVEDGQIKGIRLAAFEQYYAQAPFISQVIFRYYPDGASALTAYQQGEVMGISQVSSDVLQDALKEPDLHTFSGRLPRLSIIYLNLADEQLAFFQDAQVRRALLMGLNRQGLIDRLLNGQGIVANGPIFPETWAYYSGVEQVPFDPGAATALLKKAGYTVPAEGGDVRSKDGEQLSFELVHPDTPASTAIAEAIQRDWARLGVKAVLKALPYETLTSEYLDTRNFQAALVDLNLSRSPDPDPYPFWHQAQATGGQNYSGWDDRQASEYLEQARVLVDSTERLRRYRNFQVRFATELPSLPLFYPVYTYAVDSQVQGVRMGPLFDTSDRFNTIISWFLSARRTTPGP